MPTPRHGPGSNQYVTRPGMTVTDRPAGRDVALAVVPNDEDAEDVAWAFHPDRKKWDDCGFESWAAVQPWLSRGWDPEEASEWTQHREFTAEQATAWRDHGIDLTNASAWAFNDWTADQAALFIRGGVFTFGAAVEWNVFAGGDRDRAAELASHGFSVPVAARLLLSGGDLAVERQRWADAGFDRPWDVRTWSYAFTDPVEAKRWEATGVCTGPIGDDYAMPAADYARAGITPEEVKDWHLFQFGPRAAAAWSAAGFTARAASPWRRGEVEPEDAARRVARGEQPPPPVNDDGDW